MIEVEEAKIIERCRIFRRGSIRFQTSLTTNGPRPLNVRMYWDVIAPKRLHRIRELNAASVILLFEGTFRPQNRDDEVHIRSRRRVLLKKTLMRRIRFVLDPLRNG